MFWINPNLKLEVKEGSHEVEIPNLGVCTALVFIKVTVVTIVKSTRS